MDTVSHSATTIYSRQTLRKQQREAYQKIPGMSELLHATPSTVDDVKAKYPDAAFALMVFDNLFCHNRELSEIHQRAFFAILNGESIPNVRFRYEEDSKKYLSRHLWDD